MNDPELNQDLIQIFIRISKWLRLYHHHHVIGLENIPKQGKALLAVNHSLATYDIALLFHAIYESLDRLPRPMSDRLFHKIPYLGELIEQAGAKTGTREHGLALLKAGNLVGVAPGGMHEALRPSDQRYRLMWENRKGFVRLAIEAQAPIILALCPLADDLYKVYPSKLTEWAYAQFKIPLFFAKGFAFTPLPRPVHLFHLVGRPLMPPRAKKITEVAVDKFHKKVCAEAEILMDQALFYHVKQLR